MISFDYIDNHKAQTIVFVHGFTQNRDIFNKQIKFFKNKYNLIILDLRGHGKSKHDGPFGLEEYSDDIVELLEYVELNNFIYWGTHTGAAIGLNLYFMNKFKIDALILEGVVIPGFKTPNINKNIECARNNMIKHGLIKAQMDWLKNSEWFEYMNNNPQKTRYTEHLNIIKSFNGKPWEGKLQPRTSSNLQNKIDELNIPIFAYNGKYDMPEFLEMVDLLSSNPKVHKIEIPDSGGFPLWENPDFVNNEVDCWLTAQKSNI